MKKILFTVLCAIGFILTTNTAKAQILGDIEGMRPYKFGITAGFNGSTFSSEGFDSKAGFNVGLDLMIDASEIIKNTYLRVNLLFQRKGAKFSWNQFYPNFYDKDVPDEVAGETKARIGYVEMPISYGYAFRLTKSCTFLAETGPYFAWGVGGHYHTNNIYIREYTPFFNNNIKFNKVTIVKSPIRRDIGWDFAFGGMFHNKHQLKMSYQFGFINMNDEFQQNRNFMLNYSFFFE